MGGGEKQKANSMLDSQVGQQNTEHGNAMAQIGSDRTTAQGHATQQYDSLYGGYNNLLNSPINPSKYGAIGGGGFAAPAVVPLNAKYGETTDKYRDFMKTGGIDPNAMRTSYDTYNRFANTGNVTEADKARMRGNGVFDEFAQTGGYSAGDVQNIRARGNSVIPAMYKNISSAGDRGAIAQGGYGPGADVMRARLGRDQASGMASAARDTEIGIKQDVNAGRQWGATGVAQSESALQNLISQNMMAGADAKTATEKAIQTLTQQGTMFGTQGMQSIADTEQSWAERNAANAAQAANSNASSASADAKWRAQFELDQKMAGLGGIQGLYDGPGNGELNYNTQTGLAERGLAYDANGNLINSKISNNRSGWENVGNVAGAIAGGASAAGGVMTGIGSFRRKTPAQTGIQA